MNDEERGRDWCERNGKRPDYCTTDGLNMWQWVYEDGSTYALPLVMWEVLRSSWFQREAHAYDAVGAALRELEQRAADIRAVLEGVTTSAPGLSPPESPDRRST